MSSKQFKRLLYKNLNVAIYRVKSITTPFGVMYSDGTLILDEDADVLYLSTINLKPSDSIHTLRKENKNSLIPIGGAAFIDDVMMKSQYDPDRDGRIDKAASLDTATGIVTGDEIAEHIDDKVTSRFFHDAHGLNQKANLHGNPMELFSVKAGISRDDAINLGQFREVQNPDDSFPLSGNYYLKGFWDSIASGFPKTNLDPSQKGWYWIITKEGDDSTGQPRHWNVGDMIVYNGIGDGNQYLSWDLVPQSNFVSDPSTGLRLYPNASGGNGWALFNDPRTRKVTLGDNAIDLTFITDPAFFNKVGSSGEFSISFNQDNLSSGKNTLTSGNKNIASGENSAVIGGEGLQNTRDNELMVPNLNIGSTKYSPPDRTYTAPVKGHMQDKILVRSTIAGEEGEVSTIEDARLWTEPTTSSLVIGGEITRIDKGAGVASTEIRVGAGSGQIVNVWDEAVTPSTWQLPRRTYVEWQTTVIDIAPLMDIIAGGMTIYVDNAGSVHAVERSLTNQERRKWIQLGVVSFENPDGGTPDITRVLRSGTIANNSAQTLRDLVNFLPPRTKTQGIAILPVENERSVWQSRGSIFQLGINWENDKMNPNVLNFPQHGDSSTPLEFDVIKSDGTFAVKNGVPLIKQTELPDIYEKGATKTLAGTETDLAPGEAVVHYIYTNQDGKFILQLGQESYQNGGRARASLKEDNTTHFAYEGTRELLFLAQIYIQENAVDFSDAELAGIENSPGDFSQSADDVRAFLNLEDVPFAYTNRAGESLYVRHDELGVDFTVPSSLTEYVKITSHGFNNLQAIYNSPSGWQLARATRSEELANAIVFFEGHNDTDEFTAIYEGFFRLPNHGLTVGKDYYLQDTPGTIDAVKASKKNYVFIDQPVIKVITDEILYKYPYSAPVNTHNVRFIKTIVTNHDTQVPVSSFSTEPSFDPASPMSADTWTVVDNAAGINAEGELRAADSQGVGDPPGTLSVTISQYSDGGILGGEELPQFGNGDVVRVQDAGNPQTYTDYVARTDSRAVPGNENGIDTWSFAMLPVEAGGTLDIKTFRGQILIGVTTNPSTGIDNLDAQHYYVTEDEFTIPKSIQGIGGKIMVPGSILKTTTDVNGVINGFEVIDDTGKKVLLHDADHAVIHPSGTEYVIKGDLQITLPAAATVPDGTYWDFHIVNDTTLTFLPIPSGEGGVFGGHDINIRVYNDNGWVSSVVGRNIEVEVKDSNFNFPPPDGRDYVITGNVTATLPDPGLIQDGHFYKIYVEDGATATLAAASGNITGNTILDSNTHHIVYKTPSGWKVDTISGGGGGDGSPIGTIITFASITPPKGFLLCDGSTFNAATYPELNILLGGNTLPDLRNQFIRGASNQNQIDGYTKHQDTTRKPRTAFRGATNNAGNHRHSTRYNSANTDGNWAYADAVFLLDDRRNPQNRHSTKSSNAAGNHSHSVTINSGGDTETAPVHVYMAYHIKAKNEKPQITTTKVDPVTVSDTEPAKAAIGQMWLNKDTGDFYILTNNPAPGSTTDNWQWVQVNI